MFWCAIYLFNDGLDSTSRVADNTPEATGLLVNDYEHSQGAVTFLIAMPQSLQSCRAQQRHIAKQYHNLVSLAFKMGAGLHHSMPGAKLLFLHDVVCLVAKRFLQTEITPLLALLGTAAGGAPVRMGNLLMIAM